MPTKDNSNSSQNDTKAKLCLNCAKWAFNRWKGWASFGTEDWAKKPDLPDVPFLTNGTCARCKGIEGVSLNDIYYLNIHGFGSAGLPDYFILKIGDGNRKWGSPYLDPWITKRIPLDRLEEYIRRKKL